MLKVFKGNTVETKNKTNFKSCCLKQTKTKNKQQKQKIKLKHKNIK